MTDQPKPVVGVPVITKDDRVLCYACYQADDGADLMLWMPDDAENYPVACEECGVVLIHESQPGPTPARRSPS